MSRAPDSDPKTVGPARDQAAALRAALLELVVLKDMKTQHGETDEYRVRRERAWSEARRVLALDRPKAS